MIILGDINLFYLIYLLVGNFTLICSLNMILIDKNSIYIVFLVEFSFFFLLIKINLIKQALDL